MTFAPAPQRLASQAFFTDGLHVRLNRHELTSPFPLHWHEFYELTLVVSGAGVNTVNGVAHEVGAGDAFLLTPADFHRIAPREGTSMQVCNLIFSQAMIPAELTQLLFSQTRAGQARFEGLALERLLLRLNGIAEESECQAAGRALAVQSELNRVLIDWHRSTRPANRTVAGPMRAADHTHAGLQKALIHIQHHFRQPLTLEDAASQAHLSPNYFSELFRKSTGIAFQTYLQQLRLQFAHSLLQASALSVTEVCFVAGFNTLTHFERVFKQRYGLTPRQAQQAPAVCTPSEDHGQ